MPTRFFHDCQQSGDRENERLYRHIVFYEHVFFQPSKQLGGRRVVTNLDQLDRQLQKASA